MSAAGVNDIAAWILLALAIALSGDDSSPPVPLFGRAGLRVKPAPLTRQPAGYKVFFCQKIRPA
ncbi:unnamed protein product [Brassica napus]|uniref:(rape) hypothetical protein n=1 Tax=Brassica napus TaxID=3708 RepID=A0A816RX56_BRANA|nr:unnamed protein product [Brassica napus]